MFHPIHHTLVSPFHPFSHTNHAYSAALPLVASKSPFIAHFMRLVNTYTVCGECSSKNLRRAWPSRNCMRRNMQTLRPSGISSSAFRANPTHNGTVDWLLCRHYDDDCIARNPHSACRSLGR